MARIWFERERLSYFDEYHTYNGYAVVNNLYEDDDVRKNSWMWGKLDGDYVTDVQHIEGLSSNSYAPFSEVFEKFKIMVDMF